MMEPEVQGLILIIGYVCVLVGGALWLGIGAGMVLLGTAVIASVFIGALDALK